MKNALLALFAMLSALAPGCGTLFFHNPQKIHVTSNVPGSLVIAKNEAILGRMEGLTGEFPLDRSSDHVLLVSAPGNQAATVPVESRPSWWRILISLGGDIGLGFIPAPPVLWGVLGIITDAGSGSWQVLDDHVSVTLRPRPEPDPAQAAATAEYPPSTEQPAASDQASPPPPAAAKKPCPSCGTPCDPGAQFCPQCGTRLEVAATRPCPICGEPRPVSAATCPHCGLK